MSMRDLGVRPRFGSRSRFAIAAAGRVAEASYRAAITAARGDPGRRSFDAARSAWAAPFGLFPDDGVYLGELRAGAASLRELADAVQACGLTRAEASAAMARLVDAELVDPLDT